MELQWKSAPMGYLRCGLREVQNQEQTMELRLTEGMPDIGRVLCAWGQVLLRSKEWRKDSIGISGGVNTWVLYAPEDGSEPRCVEGWIPIQGKWNLQNSQQEGTIRIDGMLRGVDARTLSARKLMVRSSVALMAEAWEPAEGAIFTPDELPEAVQLNRKRYPICVPKEAGEQLFTLEDSLHMNGEAARKLLCCRAEPLLTEQAVLGSRIVLRGVIQLAYVYISEDDRIHSGSQELPFAQFAELDSEYDKEATAAVTLALSNLEAELDAGQLQIKCGLLGQYVIYDCRVLEVVEDAYSPIRSVKPTVSQWALPVRLDHCVETMEATLELPVQASSVVDVAFLPDYPVQYRENEKIVMELPGTFQVMYYDQEGKLQSTNSTWSGQHSLAADHGCHVRLAVSCVRQPNSAFMGDRLRLTEQIHLEMETGCDQMLNMVSGLEIGDAIVLDPKRPSLILRRAGDQTLWELAKGCGSTVDAIRSANHLTDEPAPDKMLLIPVV